MKKFGLLPLFLIVCCVAGCAGYRFSDDRNPFAEYGIQRVSVPMFVNRSSLPNIAAPLTNEMILLLSQYPDLKVYSGERSSSDAILLGVITSEDKRGEVLKTTGRKFTEDLLKDSIGERNQFFIPVGTEYKVKMQIVLIKNPTTEEIKLARSSLGKYMRNHPKIILNEIIELSSSFVRETKETVSSDSSGMVNFTKSKYSYEQSVKRMAEAAVVGFQGTVLNAF